jgi:Siderophore synthetase component
MKLASKRNYAKGSEDENELYHKFMHAVIQNHLGELIFHMSLCFDADEARLWREVKDVLQTSLCSSFPEYEEDYRAMFRCEVLTKALFKMRLQDVSGAYLYTRLPNPLAVEPS